MEISAQNTEKKANFNCHQMVVCRIREVYPCAKVENISVAKTVTVEGCSGSTPREDTVVTVTTPGLDDKRFITLKQVIKHPAEKCKLVDAREVEGRNFICFRCNKSFKESGHLKRHIKVHTGESACSCDLCGKNFMDTSDLSRHRKIHFGDKPWCCKICKKCFVSLGSLRRHMDIHNEENKRFRCETCLKRFSDRSSHKKHSLIHTGIKPHVCDVCGRAFVLPSYLKEHSRVHMEVKPYSCEQCGKDFIKHSNYTRHLLVHNGKRNFLCSICNARYNFKGSLTRHMLKHIRKRKKLTSKNFLNVHNPDQNTNVKHGVKCRSRDMASFADAPGFGIQGLNKLEESKKMYGKQNVCTANANEKLKIPLGNFANEMNEPDHTVLAPPDGNTCKQIIMENSSCFLKPSEEFGSMKHIPAPVVTPLYDSINNEVE